MLSFVVSTVPAIGIRYGIASFLTCDAQRLDGRIVHDSSVDLVVTSPPYGKRHRLSSLIIASAYSGSASILSGSVESRSGSHLRHQREGSGFQEYLADLKPCLDSIYRILKPGAFAFLVLGDSVYRGTTFDTASEVAAYCDTIGFRKVALLRRSLPESRRSFGASARRATSEKILLLERPINGTTVFLEPPPYRLWQYEHHLRGREIDKLLRSADESNELP